MQELISYCIKMYEVTGGKMHKNKVSMCFWKQKKQKIKNEPMNIKLKNELIKQTQVNESFKTLGVYVNPSLNWNDEFECVKNKMKVTIRNLMRTDMEINQAHVCFNMRMLTNMFFGLSQYSSIKN